jgi:hypothetical protein
VRFALALPLVAALAAIGRADVAQDIQRIDARTRRTARGAVVRQKAVAFRSNLMRVTYSSGQELVHIGPHDSKTGHGRGVRERSVYLTARHMRVPLTVVPPMVEAEATVFGNGYLMPWLSKLRKLSGTEMDRTLQRDLDAALRRNPARIDWESIHAILLVDYVTMQSDRHEFNIFFQKHGDKLRAVAVDNEASFGAHIGSGIDPAHGRLAQLVRSAADRHPPARRLSARLEAGLRAIDVKAWKADLAAAGLERSQVAQAAERLKQVKKHGLGAIFPEAEAKAAPGRPARASRLGR